MNAVGPGITPEDYSSGETPTNFANFTQCRGCGRRLPERMSTAYIFETPMADIIVDPEKGFSNHSDRVYCFQFRRSA